MSRRQSSVLKTNSELESAIAEDPYDEERWIVLEDWLLEVEDPRTVLIRLEKEGDTAAALRARRRLHPKLFGQRHAEIAQLVFAGNWRAGYIREFHYAGHNIEPLLALVTAPATRLCRALTLTVPPNHLDRALQDVAEGLAHVLSTLTISNADVGAPLVAHERLAALPLLRRLQLRGAYVGVPGDIAQVTDLVLAPTRNDHVRLPPMLESARFPAVRTLSIDLANIGSLEGIEAITPVALSPILARRFAPRLERFEIRNPPEPLPAPTLAALAEFR